MKRFKMLVTEITQLLNTSLAEGFQSFCELISSKPVGRVMDDIAEYVKVHELDSESFKAAQPISLQAKSLQHFLVHLYARNSIYEIMRDEPKCLPLNQIFKNLIQIAGTASVGSAVELIDKDNAKFYYHFLQTFESEEGKSLTTKNVSKTLNLLKNVLNQASSTLCTRLSTMNEKFQLQPEVITEYHINFLLELLQKSTDPNERQGLFSLYESHYLKFNISLKYHIKLLLFLINQEIILDLKIKLVNVLAYYLYLARSQIKEIYFFCHDGLSALKLTTQAQFTHTLQLNLKIEQEISLRQKIITIDEKLSQLLTMCKAWFTQVNIKHQAEKLWKESIISNSAIIPIN